MKGTSTKLVMAAALVTALSLTIVLLLVLVLLAQLYCSLLLRKRRLTTSTNTTTSALPLQSNLPSASPLGSFYAQGVLRAPRSFLFPAIINKQEEGEEDLYKQQKQQQLSSMTVREAKGSSPHCIGIVSSTSPSPPFMSVPPIHQEVGLETSSSGSTGGGGGGGEHLVYISNPIYEQPSKGDGSSSSSSSAAEFETPDSSPSHLEMGGNEEEEEEIINVEPSSPLSSTNTPPLTPMKKLSGQLVVGAACSLSLREVGTSGSCCGLSSSSSGSPCTSPSW